MLLIQQHLCLKLIWSLSWAKVQVISNSAATIDMGSLSGPLPNQDEATSSIQVPGKDVLAFDVPDSLLQVSSALDMSLPLPVKAPMQPQAPSKELVSVLDLVCPDETMGGRLPSAVDLSSSIPSPALEPIGEFQISVKDMLNLILEEVCELKPSQKIELASLHQRLEN